MPDVLITSTAAAAAVPLASKTTNFRQLTLIACKGLGGPTASPNTGLVRVGRSVSSQPYELTPGTKLVFDETSGRLADLAGLFLKVATDGDGVVASYL